MLPHHADLAQIAQRARVDEVEARCGRRRVGGGRLGRLGEALAEQVLALHVIFVRDHVRLASGSGLSPRDVNDPTRKELLICGIC
jgi:hypothetical protein